LVSTQTFALPPEPLDVARQLVKLLEEDVVVVVAPRVREMRPTGGSAEWTPGLW
jgi:hypothetical protein